MTAHLADLLEHSIETRRLAKSPKTLHVYASCFRSFEEWCVGHGLPFLPASAETVTMFSESQKQLGRKASTIAIKLAAIRHNHIAAGHASPTSTFMVEEQMAGIRRTTNTVPKRKTAATAELMAGMVERIPEHTLKGKRDRALLLMGFAGALRRSELVGLNVGDIEVVAAGIVMTIRRSKTDQISEGQVIGIPAGTRMRTAEALLDWLAVSGITEGPIFRPVGKGGRLQDTRLTDKSVAHIVKYYAKASGLTFEDFSGMSLRAGYITTASENHVSFENIMEQTRHKDIKTLRGYIRKTDLFKDHSGASFL